jgi:hypothetical protein
MKTVEEFKQHCEQHILPELWPLEARRKASLKKVILFTMVMIAGMMASVPVMEGRQAPSGLILGVCVSVLLLIVAGIKLLRLDVSGDFKHIAVAKLVSFVDPGLSYDPGGSIPREAFVASGLFPRKFKLYRGGDLITGSSGGLNIAFCNLQVMAGRSRGGKHRKENTVFHGIFFTAGPPGDAQARAMVVPQLPSMHAGRLVNKMLGFLGSGRGEPVPVNDPEFERAFAVYGNSPGEVRSILSADMRGRIMKLRQKAGRDIALAFAGPKTYVALSYGFDLFEAHLTRTVLDPGSMETDFEALKLARGIAEDLGAAVIRTA